MDEISHLLLTLLGTFIASSGFWLFMSKRFDKKSDSTLLLIGLAHERIVTLGMFYIQRGYITRGEYDSLHRFLYKPYIDLGGNGVCIKVMTDVSALSIRTPDDTTEYYERRMPDPM